MLKGKIAIVTGSASGQGEATARLFAANGASVVVADIAEEGGARVADEIGGPAIFARLDVTCEESWKALVDRAIAAFGRVDILVNNAAITQISGIDETSRETIDKVLATNTVGPMLGIQAVLPGMKAQGSGAIVNVSSVNGLRGANRMSAYDASKWGLRGLTKSLAIELAPFGIRLNTVHPGAIDTPMLDPTGSADLQALALRMGIPFRRVGRPVEVANASMFLASDLASYISGAELAVDGAWTAGRAQSLV
jgi:3alpha(or 20beta)-hydroxysteroid dehydrogenase